MQKIMVATNKVAPNRKKGKNIIPRNGLIVKFSEAIKNHDKLLKKKKNRYYIWKRNYIIRLNIKVHKS